MEPQFSDVSNPTSAHLTELERCPDVWFDDGNCVLQADNMLFKVYTGVLAKYSGVFDSLFGLPQLKADAGMEYEGCPVVMLHDAAADLRYFLRALFDLQFYSNVTKIKDATVIISVVNMSLKYEVDLLLRRSLAAFTVLYPATQSKWEIRRSRRSFSAFDEAYGRALPYVAIELAKKTGMDVMLPSAMFECCQYSIAEIMGGVATPNGNVMHLDNDSKTAILQGRALLSHQAHTSKVEIAYTEVALRQVNMTLDLQKQWEMVHAWVRKADGPDQWVSPLLMHDFPYDAYTRIVRQPSKHVVMKITEKRRVAWMELPKAFGLRDWDKMKRAMIH